MERLSTLYNADVGLYMLANKVCLLSYFACCVLYVCVVFLLLFYYCWDFFVRRGVWGVGCVVCFGFWIEFLRE